MEERSASNNSGASEQSSKVLVIMSSVSSLNVTNIVYESDVVFTDKIFMYLFLYTLLFFVTKK